ncbi:MAG: glutamyl-tRNA reductase, partial [Armatimonadota bacterium]|nr:glutamyl-tRNA reductase [Armatimonadota bacterium]
MIAAVGITHKTAPLAVRERFALPRDTARRALQSLPGEALLLTTCNRTELYGTAPASQLAERLLAAAGWSGGGASIDPLVVWDAAEAVRHLLAVAAGLDSMVVGEPQVLAQVRAALAEARTAGRLGTVLDRLGQRALVAGRRVRAETPLGRDRPTIPRVAVQAAGELLGGLRGRRRLLVGAGKVGMLTARALRRQDLDAILVANRTIETAR